MQIRGARKGAALPKRYWQPGLAGLLSGIVFFMLSVLTFYVLGVVPGILFNPEIQSPKVIAVVQALQPPPLMQRAPYIVFAAWTVTLIGYSYLFHHIRPLWPQSYWSCLWRLALMIWFFSLLFFQFQGPLNLLDEPLSLFALELLFWAICAGGAAAVIVAVPRPKRGNVNSQ